jgi:hypothetical protein
VWLSKACNAVAGHIRQIPKPRDAQLTLRSCVGRLNRAENPLFATSLASLCQLKHHSYQIYGSIPFCSGPVLSSLENTLSDQVCLGTEEPGNRSFLPNHHLMNWRTSNYRFLALRFALRNFTRVAKHLFGPAKRDEANANLIRKNDITGHH